MPHRRPVIRHSHVGAPHALTSLLEARGLLEMAMLPASLPLLLEAPQGDGHPVLLVPGYMLHNWSNWSINSEWRPKASSKAL